MDVAEAFDTVFLSTPSARRATSSFHTTGYGAFDFYPRPPRGGRHQVMGLEFDEAEFLSTPSARRATVDSSSNVYGWVDISIHALREEGDLLHKTAGHLTIISIHALREEGDLPPRARMTTSRYFYPRPPRGGRQCWHSFCDPDLPISIHALREEGDGTMAQKLYQTFISIHALREEGDQVVKICRRLR